MKEIILLPVFIPKYAREAAGGRFSAYLRMCLKIFVVIYKKSQVWNDVEKRE